MSYRPTSSKALHKNPSVMLRLVWLCAAATIAFGACVIEEVSDDGGGSGDPAGPGQVVAGPGAGGAGGAGSGAGTGGTLPPACDPYIPRPAVPEAVIGPIGLESKIVSMMDSAQSELWLTMYQLSCNACVNGLIAAHNRGVNVRVLLDPEQWVNGDSGDDLRAAGVEVRDTPAEFNHAHAKVLIVDGKSALVMSANMNLYTSGERNYGVVDSDPQDVADIEAIFERDWNGSGPVDVSCTRLIVSPENSRERILAHINSAQNELSLAVMYISDSEVMSAVKAKKSQGVNVRVLLAHPEWIDSNYATADELIAAGIPARWLYTWELHAKLVIADGVSLVGSHNMSYNSIENNREIGMLVTEDGPASQIVQQFETDWADGYTP